MNLQQDIRVYDYVPGRNTVPMNDRYNFDVDKLVDAGVVFITPAIDGDPKSPTYKEWLDEDHSHLLTLFNVKKSSPDGWICKAITKKSDTSKFRHNFTEKLYDGKYNQILWSLEKLEIDPNDMVIEDNSLQESIRRILREELNNNILIDGLYDPIYEENGIVLFKEPKKLKVYSKFEIKKSNVISGKEFNKKYVDFNNKKLHKVLYKNGITLGRNLGEGKYWCSTEYCLSVYLGETQESEEYSKYVKEVVNYKLGDDMKIIVKKYISDNLW